MALRQAWQPQAVGGIARRMAQAWLNRGLDADALRALQEKKLRRVVAHAYATVPFYRQMFDEIGLRPEDIRSLDDLKRIPITGRTERQVAGDEALLSRAYASGGLRYATSSGTTGRPIRVAFEPHFDQWRRAVFLRALIAGGYRLGDKAAIVLRKPEPQHAPRWTRLRYLTGELAPQGFFDELRRFQPNALYSSATALRETLDAVGPIAPLEQPIRRVFTTSEALDGRTKDRLRRTLGGELIDLYGSAELGLVAWECREHAGYHVADDTIVVELVADRPNQPARLVATNLEAWGMPFIRYDTGDLAQPGARGACACGSAFSRIGRIDGRRIDTVRRRDGGLLPAHDFTDAMETLPGLRRYQVIQEAFDEFRVLVVTEPGQDDGLERRVAATLEPVLWSEATLRVERHENIDPDPGSKFRVVMSRCAA